MPSKSSHPPELLTRGIAEVIDRSRLEQRLRSGERLRLKLGIDPTGARLHLGHAVALRTLRRFQDHGHTVVLIIGDTTASIGDPSGKNETRPPLTAAQIRTNFATYAKQAFKILNPKRTEVRKQSEWFRSWKLGTLIEQASKLSAGWVLSHETFRSRMQSGQPLAFHELLYPLLQAYDSVAVKADVEFGGLDQKFNLLTGRELMRAHGLPPQDVVLVKYLVGTDGQKMGKSLGNFIALEEEPFEMFGKVMSMPDTVLPDYFELATDVPVADMKKLHWSGAEARNTKMFLARKIVEAYHGGRASNQALKRWNDFISGTTAAGTLKLSKVANGTLLDLVVATAQASSKSEAKRLIEQGGAVVNGAVERDWRKKVAAGDRVTIGKKKLTYTVQA